MDSLCDCLLRIIARKQSGQSLYLHLISISIGQTSFREEILVTINSSENLIAVTDKRPSDNRLYGNISPDRNVID